MSKIISDMKTTQNESRAKRFFAITLAMLCLLSLLGAPVAYARDAASVTLSVKQAFHARGSFTPAEDSFTYHLTSRAQTGVNPLPAGATADGYVFTLAGNVEDSVGPLLFHEPGIYRYHLGCVTNSGVNLECDQQVYTIAVYVKSDLSASVVVHTAEGDKTSEISFVQSYQALPTDPTVMVDPPVTKTISGDRPTKSSTFTFRLKADDASWPMPEGSADGEKILRIVGEGTRDFGTWSYTHEGVYRYAVSEVNTEISGYDYDTAIYTITDTVQDVEGRLVVDRVVTDRDGKTLESLPLRLPFDNHYTSPDKAGGSLAGKISSRLPKTGDLPGPALILASGLAFAGVLILLWRHSRRRRQI